jgi:RND superfamily putative drug exporter
MKFLKGLCGLIIKLRFFIVAFWLVAAAALYFLAPSLADVTKSDAASFFSDDSETTKAGTLYKELFPEEGSRASFIVALEDRDGLGGADRQYALALEKYLLENKGKYSILDVTSPFTEKEYESAMVSQDGKAAVLNVSMTTVAWMDDTNAAVRSVKADIAGGAAPAVPQGLSVHVTGDAPLGQEQVDNVHKSIDITTKITIGLIVVILLLIYRAPLAPVLPLATIGLSFLITRSVVALLTFVGLKASSFTETFLIALLFGAGTDYCLLLVSRYREELAGGLDAREALLAAFPRTAGAILSSGGTVAIGFLGMILAAFGLFSSIGPSIAIGIGVTLLAVLSLTPALAAIFGERIFWPAHPSKNRERETRGSPFWRRLSAAVVKRPTAFMLASLAVFLPFMILSANVTRAFDTLEELPDNSATVAGYESIKAHFDQGEMLPVKIVLKSDKDLWSNECLQAIDNVAQDVLKVDGVAKVRAATRPAGEQINEISLPEQLNALTSGLGDAEGGFDQLSGGLTQAKDGLDEASDGIDQAAGGVGDMADGTKQASGGISGVSSGLGSLSGAQNSAAGGLDQLNAGLGDLNAGLDQTKMGLVSMQGALGGAKTSLEALLASPSYPGLAADPQFQIAYGTVCALADGMPDMIAGIDALKGGIAQSRQGLTDAASGLRKIKSGIDQSRAALNKVKSGLEDLAAGQDEAAQNLGLAADSLGQISDGLQQSIDGINEMKTQMAGAEQSAGDWSSGLKEANSVFYLPDGALDKYPELKKFMQVYISPNGRGAIFDVILSLPPYGEQALDAVGRIEDAARFSMKGGPLEGAEFYASGATGTMRELRDVTSADFVKVLAFVLLGIFVVLAVLLRSLTAPFYLIATILVSYLTTLGISWLVFQVGLGYAGLSWSVPFFSFVLLVALGVDYNIFLMSRVKEEYRPGHVATGTAKALASTGKIITSCGIIMAGTFSALLLSPVAELVQIGFATVVGLLLDTFIVRCMLVPALVVKVGELNWWPGRKVKILAVERKGKEKYQLIEKSE